MRTGQKRHRITLQTPSVTRDSHGAAVKSWADRATLWANVEPLTGKETADAAGVEAMATHRLTMRYFNGITPDWRVIFTTRVLSIESVIDVGERKRETQLMCLEEVGETA